MALGMCAAANIAGKDGDDEVMCFVFARWRSVIITLCWRELHLCRGLDVEGESYL